MIGDSLAPSDPTLEALRKNPVTVLQSRVVVPIVTNLYRNDENFLLFHKPDIFIDLIELADNKSSDLNERIKDIEALSERMVELDVKLSNLSILQDMNLRELEEMPNPYDDMSIQLYGNNEQSESYANMAFERLKDKQQAYIDEMKRIREYLGTVLKFITETKRYIKRKKYRIDVTLPEISVYIVRDIEYRDDEELQDFLKKDKKNEISRMAEDETQTLDKRISDLDSIFQKLKALHEFMIKIEKKQKERLDKLYESKSPYIDESKIIYSSNPLSANAYADQAFFYDKQRQEEYKGYTTGLRIRLIELGNFISSLVVDLSKRKKKKLEEEEEASQEGSS